MSIEQNSGKPARLSLAERAKQGLLLSEPGLSLDDIVNLEHPGNLAGRKTLRPAIRAAIDYSDLATRTVCRPWQRTVWKSVGGWLDGNPNWDEKRLVNESGATKTVLIDRETYRAWRNACPVELLSPLSQIHKWLGATPPAESIPPVETSLPESLERAIALVEAENAALVALRKALKREPDFEEFWDYLTTQDETGTVADCTDNRLDWIGHAGKSCSTAKSTIRNRLTAAKKRNPFTPS